MLSNVDWAAMRADLTEIVGDNETSISVRRAGVTLDPQTVRIVRSGGGASQPGSAGGEESRGQVLVYGFTNLDIEVGDRFNDTSGILYRALLIRPNRIVGIVVEAEVIQ